MSKLIVATVSFFAPIFLLLVAWYGSPPGAWEAAMDISGTDAGDVYGLIVGSFVVFILCLHNFLDALFDLIKNRRRKEKVIEVHVDAATYDRLQLMASDLDIPLAAFCACCFEAVDPVELEEARRELGILDTGS